MSSKREEAEDSGDNETEKTLVNFNVGVNQKKKWENWIEETGRYATLTGLIRTAVELHIKNEGAEGPPESPALAEDIQHVQDDLERVRKDVRWLRKQEQDNVNISDTAQEVFAALEKIPEDRTTNTHLAAMMLGPGNGESEENSQTVEAIAERIGLTEDIVEDAIEHLQEQFLPIVEIERGGATHYFREE